jgi:hypothetical protein
LLYSFNGKNIIHCYEDGHASVFHVKMTCSYNLRMYTPDSKVCTATTVVYHKYLTSGTSGGHI